MLWWASIATLLHVYGFITHNNRKRREHCHYTWSYLGTDHSLLFYNNFSSIRSFMVFYLNTYLYKFIFLTKPCNIFENYKRGASSALSFPFLRAQRLTQSWEKVTEREQGDCFFPSSSPAFPSPIWSPQWMITDCLSNSHFLWKNSPPDVLLPPAKSPLAVPFFVFVFAFFFSGKMVDVSSKQEEYVYDNPSVAGSYSPSADVSCSDSSSDFFATSSSAAAALPPDKEVLFWGKKAVDFSGL